MARSAENSIRHKDLFRCRYDPRNAIKGTRVLIPECIAFLHHGGRAHQDRHHLRLRIQNAYERETDNQRTQDHQSILRGQRPDTRIVAVSLRWRSNSFKCHRAIPWSRSWRLVFLESFVYTCAAGDSCGENTSDCASIVFECFSAVLMHSHSKLADLRLSRMGRTEKTANIKL